MYMMNRFSSKIVANFIVSHCFFALPTYFYLFHKHISLYHSASWWVSGTVGWLKPWMLPEILSVEIPPSLMKGNESTKGAAQKFIDDYNSKHRRPSMKEMPTTTATKRPVDVAIESWGPSLLFILPWFPFYHVLEEDGLGQVLLIRRICLGKGRVKKRCNRKYFVVSPIKFRRKKKLITFIWS